MTLALPAFFGSPEQQALLKRGADLHQVTKSLRHCAYYGRTVGLTSPEDVPLETLVALINLQGNSNFATLPDHDVPGLSQQLIALGLNPTHYARWVGKADTLNRAKDIISRMSPPERYSIEWLEPQTSAATRHALAQTCLLCGVLPPSLDVLSGALQPGLCCMAIDQSGDVAGCAAAASFLNPDHPEGRDLCWWGMLSVHPDHRGQALSLLLGAAVLVKMQERFGFTSFFTGVEPGNTPSEAICDKMALCHAGQSILAATNPDIVPGGRMTK